MKRNYLEEVSELVVVFLFLFAFFCVCYVIVGFFQDVCLSNILERKITIYKDNQPVVYDPITLYYVYDSERSTVTEGPAGGILAMKPYKKIELKSLSFPVWVVVAFEEMELKINLVSGEVKAGNEVAEELFALEGKQFFSCDF